jgi:uncharacterized protein DUF1579
MKRMLLVMLTAALSLGVAVAGPGENGSSTPEMMPIGPSPELKKLEFLVGKCTAKGKMYMPGQAAVDWSGSDKTTWTKDGRYIKSESKMSCSGMGEDVALTMIAYDQQAKIYRLWRYSSFTTVPIEATGSFEGEKLVFNTNPCEKGMVFRVTFEPKAKREVAFLLEMKVGENYEKVQDGIFMIKA